MEKNKKMINYEFHRIFLQFRLISSRFNTKKRDQNGHINNGGESLKSFCRTSNKIHQWTAFKFIQVRGSSPWRAIKRKNGWEMPGEARGTTGSSNKIDESYLSFSCISFNCVDAGKLERETKSSLDTCSIDASDYTNRELSFRLIST